MRTLIFFLFLIPIQLIAQNIAIEDHDLYNGNIYLPGTLTYPKSNQKLPLVIFVHGSGNVDRNGNQGIFVQADYIKQLADSLNVRNIAFYRYDKRTATEQNFKHVDLKHLGIIDFVKDVGVAIEKFSNDKRFSSIHLIGHSQGSLVAMLAIDKNIDSYISIAGPGVSIENKIIEQLSNQNPELGNVAKAHFAELVETDTILDVDPKLISILAPQNQSFLKRWISWNPTEEIKKIKIPVLIINGDADLQVSPKDAKLLKEALPEAQLAIIPKTNHVLKVVQSIEENQKSYGDPSVPLSSQLTATISKFILSQ